MTSLPDWLVERAALDELSPDHRARIDRADPEQLADRIAALRAEDAAERAAHPSGPALAQIAIQIGVRRDAARNARRRRLGVLAGVAAIAVVVVVAMRDRGSTELDAPRVVKSSAPIRNDGVRVKGTERLDAFLRVDDRAEHLDEDALVKAGDEIQLRYHAGDRSYGVIASIDGAGVVTLHHPDRESAPPAATALSARATSLPQAYALDDAPRFERFFFITADHPLDVHRCLDALRALAHHADSATAPLELPSDLHQWSLRLRKPAPPPTRTP